MASLLQAMRAKPMAFGRQMQLTLNGSPDSRVAQTIGAMQAMAIDAARHSELVHQAAVEIVRGVAQMDFGAQLRALYAWLEEKVRFKRDTAGVEHVRTPDQLLAEIDAHGMTAADCDDLATLGAAIGLAMGFPMAFIVDGQHEDGPLEHVYIAARWRGEWYPLDPQHRAGSGQWPDAGRRRLWTVEEPAS